MTRDQFYSEIRALVGNPSVNEVSDSQLEKPLRSALEWLADILKFEVKTDERGIKMSAGSREYPLPTDLNTLIWARWNGNFLEPKSIYEWQRDGVDYLDGSASNPAEFAIFGMQIVLNPPPSSDAVSTDPFVALRYYVSSGEDMRDSDLRLAIYFAAIEYMTVRNVNNSFTNAIRGLGELLSSRIPLSRNRAQNPIETYYPTIKVFTRRRGPSR